MEGEHRVAAARVVCLSLLISFFCGVSAMRREFAHGRKIHYGCKGEYDVFFVCIKW